MDQEMDHSFHTPTKRRGTDGGALSTCGVSSWSAAASPSVRRRAPSPSASAVKVEPPSPPRSPPPGQLSAPSADTVRRVMSLRDSVASVIYRLQQRPPVYATAQPPLDQRVMEDRRTVESPWLGDDFWSHIGISPNSRHRREAPTGPLSDEQRRKLFYAVRSLQTRLSGATYPSMDVLSHLLRQSEAHCDGEVRRRCLLLLRRVAFLHPPHGRLMRNLYHAVLAGPEKNWKPLHSSIECCLRPSGGDTTTEQHLLNTELLDLQVSLLEENLTFWWRSSRWHRPSNRLGRPNTWPLLVAALWRTEQQPGASVAATRQLCRWLVEAHAASRDQPVDMVTRRLLLRLMAMAAEVTRVKDQRSLLEVTGNMQSMAGDLSRAVQEKHLDAAAVDELLCALRPAWLSARLAAWRLNQRHGRDRLAGPLTLQLIHAHLLSEKENRTPPSGTSAAVGIPGSNGALELTTSPARLKRALRSPVSSPVKKRVSWKRLGDEGESVSQRSADSASGDAADREYSALVLHVLSSHLLHTGLTDVRLYMTRRLLGETTAGRTSALAVPAPAAAARDITEDQLITYRRELEWIQDRLWRQDGATRLDPQYELFMKTVTKI